RGPRPAERDPAPGVQPEGRRQGGPRRQHDGGRQAALGPPRHLKAGVRFGVVILPEERWSVAGRTWQRAESLGFDHAWTYDHLAWRSLRDRPWFAAVPVLVAAAAATTRIRLGPLVASPNFR